MQTLHLHIHFKKKSTRAAMKPYYRLSFNSLTWGLVYPPEILNTSLWNIFSVLFFFSSPFGTPNMHTGHWECFFCNHFYLYFIWIISTDFSSSWHSCILQFQFAIKSVHGCFLFPIALNPGLLLRHGCLEFQ